MNIPAFIELPDAGDPENPFFRSITHATIAELRTCIDHRAKALDSERREVEVLKSLLATRREEKATDADLVFAPGSSLQLEPMK